MWNVLADIISRVFNIIIVSARGFADTLYQNEKITIIGMIIMVGIITLLIDVVFDIIDHD